METISQAGTNIVHEIFIKANIIFIDGRNLILHLTKEEYQSFEAAIENGNIRWHFLRKSKDGKSYISNEWVFLHNCARVSYSEEIVSQNGFAVT